MASALLEPEQHLVPDPEIAHGDRPAAGGDEAYRLRVLDDRARLVPVRGRLDEQEGTALDLHPPDDRVPRAAVRVDGEDLVPRAELAQVLRLAAREEDVRVDGPRVHAERTGGDVARLHRLRVDEEEGGRTVPDEHPLPHPEEGARVDAHAVPEAERADPGDLPADEGQGGRLRVEDGTDRAHLVRARRRQEDPVDADLHRLEEQLRLRGVVGLDEEAGPAPLEVRDQVLEGDDLPVLRAHDDVLRRPAEPAHRALVLRLANRREPADLLAVEQERSVPKEDRGEATELLELVPGRVEDDLIEPGLERGGDDGPNVRLVLGGEGPHPYQPVHGGPHPR